MYSFTCFTTVLHITCIYTLISSYYTIDDNGLCTDDGPNNNYYLLHIL